MAMMEQVRSEPRGEPVAYYFRDLLLIGGDATRLYLVRHAQSEGNRGEYDDPDNDPPLSAVGLEQAGRLARRFTRQRVDAVYASPLRRALETARAIADQAGLQVCPLEDLREVDLGAPQREFGAYTEEQALALRERLAGQPTWDTFPGSEGSASARRRAGVDPAAQECARLRVVRAGGAHPTPVR